MRFMKNSMLAFFCVFTMVASSWAGGYPEKPIELVVGFKAGGAADTLARVLSKELSTSLGQPVVVLNKPGGGGGVAAAYVKSAAPDGYTIAVSTDPPFTFSPNISSSPVGYAVSDFVYLDLLGAFQPAFVAKSDFPYATFKDVVDASKSGTVFKYGTFVLEEKFPTMKYAKENGLKFLPVPMKGGAAIMTGILGGHVDFGYSGGIHKAYVDAGQMKVLAMASNKRSADNPDVPTLIEQGVNIDLTTKFIALAPAGVPADICKKLESAFLAAVKSPEYKKVVSNLNMMEDFGGSDVAGDYITARVKYFSGLGI